MRRAVLFIAGLFVFSACAPKLTVKEFNDFTNELKKTRVQNEATAMGHLELTRETMKDIDNLRQRLGGLEKMIGALNFRTFAMAAFTNQIFDLLLKALERKGIKIDPKKEWERYQKEMIEKKLKEKSK